MCLTNKRSEDKFFLHDPQQKLGSLTLGLALMSGTLCIKLKCPRNNIFEEKDLRHCPQWKLATSSAKYLSSKKISES